MITSNQNIEKKQKLSYIGTLSYIKTEDIHADIAKDIEIRSDMSNYELDRHYLKKKNKKNNLINDR